MTSASGGQRSIQLSYGRARRYYILQIRVDCNCKTLYPSYVEGIIAIP